jgi:hypothetical protein
VSATYKSTKKALGLVEAAGDVLCLGKSVRHGNRTYPGSGVFTQELVASTEAKLMILPLASSSTRTLVTV